ncbi:MAG: bile acid:sodium symporter family protein, partial [Actinomycetales bacterium]
PVAVGMVVRRRSEGVADRADRPVRIFSIVVLVAVSVGAILGERENIVDYTQQVGLLMALFCLISLTVGYVGARLLRLDERQAVSCSMEIGIHNTTVALTIALSVLDSSEVAIPAAVYSIVMYVLAAAFGYLVLRPRTASRAARHAVR